jgi:ATP-dependent RNA helicase RhlE
MTLPSASPSESGFSAFALAPSVLRGVDALGFEAPRPIQAQTIPAALEGRDVLGLAQTGTGKTAAFVLPILQRLNTRRRPGPRALIVAPTRELAMQIQAETVRLAQFCGLKVTAIFGGVGVGPQIRALRERPDILVACPGRLLDLMQQGHAKLGSIEVLVLDEADHMFDMGFLPGIRRILAALPAERQNLLFSATMPQEVRSLTAQLLRRPHVVELAHSRPAETIEHALYPVPADSKVGLLQHLLKEDDFTSAIVFLRTKHRARKLAQQLKAMGHDAAALEGNMSQAQRDRAMSGFRDGRFDVLVATDIAARGIDVANVSHVINFDVPNTPDAYTHRIGRTGRAERRGKAFTFAGDDDRQAVRDIERKLGAPIRRLPLPRLEVRRPPSESPQRAALPHVTNPTTHRSRPHAGPPRQRRSPGSARRRRARATSW